MNAESDDTFYGTYSFCDFTLDVTSARPFYSALNRVVCVYIISRSMMQRLFGKTYEGFLVGHNYPEDSSRRYVIYCRDDLAHVDRLITLGHELVHIILEMQGYPVAMHYPVEGYIDKIVKQFYRRNPKFLEWVYKYNARLG